MSAEKAKELMERLKTDEAFRNEFHKVALDQQEPWLRGQGYDFTKEEFEAAMGELDEQDLDQISGGFNCNSYGDCGTQGCESKTGGCSSQCEGDSSGSCGTHCSSDTTCYAKLKCGTLSAGDDGGDIPMADG